MADMWRVNLTFSPKAYYGKNILRESTNLVHFNNTSPQKSKLITQKNN